MGGGAKLQDIISYFKNCHQADNRAISLSNFLGSKVEQQIILSTAELLEGKLIQYPINTEWAEAASKTLHIYAKEKDLYCGAIFLLDKKMALGKVRNICAPLLLFPLNLFEEDGVFYLEIDSGASILNPAFVSHLKSSSEESVGLNDYISKNIPNGFIDFEAMQKIEEVLENAFPQLDLNPLTQFPKVFSVRKIKKALKELEKPLIIPAVGVGILKKSFVAKGILHELDEMTNNKVTSAVLSDLFFEKSSGKKLRRFSGQIFTPANLSQSQERIIHSSESNTNTLVIGPPGTGKSFTIAAMAIDAISKGRSILISSKNNQALDVIAHKIETDFGFEALCVRGGDRDYKRFLKNKIANILNGVGVSPASKKVVQAQKKGLVKQLKLIKEIEKLVNQMEKAEIDYGMFQRTPPKGLFQWFQNKILQRKLEKSAPFYTLIDKFRTEMLQYHRLLEHYVKYCLNANIYATSSVYRRDFQHLLTALRARTGLKKEQFFETANFSVLLKAFPVWLVNTNDIHAFLPLRKELFDLVVIDEATQCDIASALPILYRAKKSVIIGDPKQLRHISFLSRKQQLNIANNFASDSIDSYLLNYRAHSILDIVSHSIDRQSQVLFLDEHYRSLPDIIHFSNAYFYGNALKVMKQTPQQEGKTNVGLTVCEGKREKRGFNRVEANKIIEEVLEIIKEEADLGLEYCQSIGILSPFREQANYLRNKIDKLLSIEQLQRHRILIGTPFTFQGEERDIMFISFAIDAQVHASVYLYLNREDVFNVGITRARVEQRLFISMHPEQLNKKYLIAKYLHDVLQNKENLNRVLKKKTLSVADQFLFEVVEALKERGIHKIYPEYQIAGTKIDLLFIAGDETVGVDLVGFPGVYEASFGIDRYKMLFRVGLRVVVLTYRLWKADRNSCMEMMLP